MPPTRVFRADAERTIPPTPPPTIEETFTRLLDEACARHIGVERGPSRGPSGAVRPYFRVYDPSERLATEVFFTGQGLTCGRCRLSAAEGDWCVHMVAVWRQIAGPLVVVDAEPSDDLPAELG